MGLYGRLVRKSNGNCSTSSSREGRLSDGEEESDGAGTGAGPLEVRKSSPPAAPSPAAPPPPLAAPSASGPEAAVTSGVGAEVAVGRGGRQSGTLTGLRGWTGRVHVGKGMHTVGSV